MERPTWLVVLVLVIVVLALAAVFLLGNSVETVPAEGSWRATDVAA
ncbi:hypothetical protein [Nocardioides sp. SYSU D00038]|nr:hypothetical protein [Nocardioides sp. SYSU D00038]